MYKCLFLEDNMADGSRASIPEYKKNYVSGKKRNVLPRKKIVNKEHEGEKRSADVGPFATDVMRNQGKKVKYRSSRLKVITRSGQRSERPTPIGQWTHGVSPKY